MWFILIFLFLYVENAISQSPYNITFLSHRNISENRKKQQQAFFGSKIISNSQVFQQQLYNQGITQQNAQLKHICNELLEQQTAQEVGYAIPVVQENSQEYKPTIIRPKEQKTNLPDKEKYAAEQFQKELTSLQDVIKEYEYPDEYHSNIIAYEHIAFRYERRHIALQNTLSDQKRFKEEYELAKSAQKYMQEKKIELPLLTHFSGTYIQHVIHQEILTLIEGMPVLNERLRSKKQSTEITDIATDFVMVGCEFNRAGYITKAITIADFCWSLREVALGIGDMGYELFLEVYHEPREAILHLATGIPLGLYSAGRMLVKIVKEIGTLAQITVTDFFDEKRSKELCDDFIGCLMAFDKQVKDTISAFSSLGLRGAARIGSRAYIDAWLLGKAGSALSKFSSIAKNQGLAYAKKAGKVIKKFTEQEQVAVAVQGFVFPIVEQAYECMDGLQQIGKEAINVTISLLEAREIWNKSDTFKKLKDIVQSLEKKARNSLIKPLDKTAKTVKEYLALENDAKKFYETVRNIKNDISQISKHTGIPKEIIRQIKEHIFFNTHILFNGVRRFDPQCDIAAVWQRLINNQYVKTDLKWILHEYAESVIMQGKKVDWRTAHDLVEQVFPWISYINK